MRRRLLALIAAMTVVMGSVTLAAAPQASAIDSSQGRPGFCPTSKGVTVVVDFQQLGGTTIVRCYPGGSGTGLDALKGAGFQIEGVQRWGEGFICRIENKPASGDSLPVKGRNGYKERCADTPPASAYWSYWTAGNNCSWQYSQWGVKNRKFIKGGFEGWSFSLNATAKSNPRPRIAPVRPGSAGGSCSTRQEAGPSSTSPDERQGGVAGSASGSDTSSDDTSADSSTLPEPLPRPSTTPPDPSENVEFTGGENVRNVNADLRDRTGASRWAPWAAGGGLAVLLAATALVAARRRST